MRHWFIIVFSTLFVWLAFSQPKGNFITLKRTICYGRCPVFEVTVWSSGKVVFVGEQFVAAMGRKEYWVKKDSAKQLFTLARRINFFSMPKGFFGESNTFVTDQPSKFITVHLGDSTKTVQDDFGLSPELGELERAIYRIAKTRFLIYKE